jgi:hypothetical protein
MWDTVADYWIASNLSQNSIFYFVNPEVSVLKDFEKYMKNGITYKFIIERKNLIFEMKAENIDVIEL